MLSKFNKDIPLFLHVNMSNLEFGMVYFQCKNVLFNRISTVLRFLSWKDLEYMYTKISSRFGL